MHSTWIDKYSPKKISDITCNIKGIKIICNWLKNYNNNKVTQLANMEINKTKKRGRKSKKFNNIDDTIKTPGKQKEQQYSCLLIHGDHGVGKTTIIKTILNQYKYDVHILNLETLKLHNNLDIYMDKLFSDNILNIFKNEKNNKSVILIDDIESITSINEKSLILSLQKLNDMKWYCPIIYISSGKHSKLLTHLKDNTLAVKLYEPSKFQLKNMMDNIIKKENILMSYTLAFKIIEHAQSDIRRLITILEDLKKYSSSNTITQSFFDEYINTYRKKDVNVQLQKGAQKLMYNYTGITDCLKYYESEKVLLPLMLHLHYLSGIISSCNNKKKIFNTVNIISNLISFTDVMENIIYSDQNWNMQELHGIYSCAIISYYLNKLGVHNSVNHDLYFPLDLNRTSIKQINKKNILNADKFFVNMNVIDYIYMTKIITRMINTHDVQTYNTFLETYNITTNSIEILLKIDKISKNKSISHSKKKNIVHQNITNSSEILCKTTYMKNMKSFYEYNKISKNIISDLNL
jgi:hypothetical protein